MKLHREEIECVEEEENEKKKNQQRKTQSFQVLRATVAVKATVQPMLLCRTSLVLLHCHRFWKSF